MNQKFNNVKAVTSKVMAKLKTKWFELALSGLTIFAVNYILSVAVNLPAWFTIMFLGFMLIAEVGYLKALLNDEPVRLENIFSDYKLAFSGFLILMFLMFGTAFGLVFLIVPGVWFFATYIFSLNVLQKNKQIGAIEAFKQSAEVSKGYKWEIVIMLAVCVVLGGLVYGVSALAGLIASLIFSSVVWSTFALGMFYVVCMVAVLPLFLMIIELFYEQIENGDIKKVEKVAKVKKPKKAKVKKAKKAKVEEVKTEEDDIEIADID